MRKTIKSNFNCDTIRSVLRKNGGSQGKRESGLIVKKGLPKGEDEGVFANVEFTHSPVDNCSRQDVLEKTGCGEVQ